MADQMYIDPATGAVTPKKVPGAIPIDPATGAADPSGRVPGTSVKGFSGGGDAVQGGVTGSADAPSDRGPTAGGGATSGGTGPGKSFDIDNMLRTYLPGLTDPAQIAAVKQAIHQIAGAENSGSAYHQAIDQLVQKYPDQLSGDTPMGKAFGTSKPGQLSAQVMQGLTDWTNAYQKPFLDSMQNDTQAVMGALKGLTPKLPASYQNLVNTQAPQMGKLTSDIANLLKLAQPGQIANAYATYNNIGSTPASGGLSLQSLTNPTTPKTG